MTTSFLSFILGCRDCYNSDGCSHIIAVHDGNEVQYRRLTEYEVVEMIENWRWEEGKVCNFCGSGNVEIDHVSYNDDPLYKGTFLKFKYRNAPSFIFALLIDRKNSMIKIEMDGSKDLTKYLTIKCLEFILAKINSIPNQNFKEFPVSHFFIVISGSRDNKDMDDWRYQCLQYAGYSKIELNEIIKLKMSEYLDKDN